LTIFKGGDGFVRYFKATFIGVEYELRMTSPPKRERETALLDFTPPGSVCWKAGLNF
jgi:hypothetical protein